MKLPSLLLLGAAILGAALAAPPPALAAQTNACSALADVPDAMQVAWISPMKKTVGTNTWLEVVRVQDLRAWVRAQGADQLRLLQGLGLANAKGRGRHVKGDWKITIFDVKSDWVCRPVEDSPAGKDLLGAPVCENPSAVGPRRGYSGCGYAVDGLNAGRGLDVFRMRWRDASRAGFCVMPLERFLSGA